MPRSKRQSMLRCVVSALLSAGLAMAFWSTGSLLPHAPLAQQPVPGDRTPLCWFPLRQSSACATSPEQVCESWEPLYGPVGPPEYYNDSRGRPAAECVGWNAQGNQQINVHAQTHCGPYFGGRKETWGGCIREHLPITDCNDPCGPSNGRPGPFPLVGDPVFLATGDLVEEELDFTTSGQSPLTLERRYAYRAGQAHGSFGFGWSSILDAHVVAGSSYTTVYMPGGAQYVYTRNGSTGAYVTSGTRADRLEQVNSSTFRWTSVDGSRFTFANVEGARHRITEVGDASGGIWFIDWQSGTVTDLHGRQLVLQWAQNPAGVLNSVLGRVTAPGGLTVDYAYDFAPVGTTGRLPNARRLRGVTRSAPGQAARTIHYDYEDPSHPYALTAVRNELGVATQNWTWDSSARVTQNFGWNGLATFLFTYDSATTRTVTTPLGRVQTYLFQAGGSIGSLLRVTEAASVNAAASVVLRTWSGSNGWLTSFTDAQNRKTTFVRDAIRGVELSRTEAAQTSDARTVTTAWDPARPLPTQIDEPGRRTAFTYDAAGNVLTRTVTDLTTFTAPYATNGRARTWTYSWLPGGLLNTVDGPLPGSSDTTDYDYDAQGHLRQVTDGVGHVTLVNAVNGRGQPLDVSDSNGVRTTLAYDLDGRPTTVTVDPGPYQSHYQLSYDLVGRLTGLILPGGGSLTYSYDPQGRMTRLQNDRGQRIDYTHNAIGQVTSTQVRDAAGALTTQSTAAYDELGRLIRSIGAAGQTTTVGYNLNGEVVSVADARGELFGTGFDPLGRVISETDPEARTIAYGYDPRDGLIQHTDGRGVVTTRVVDGFGDTVRETSPDRGVRDYLYDAGGRLVRVTDGDGQITDFAYDAAGRRTAATFAGASAENVAWTYDSTVSGNRGIGRLTGVTDQPGGASYVYGAQGRVTAETRTIQGRAYVTAYVYDANGELTAVTYPSGRVATTSRASDGLATGVATRVSAGALPQTVASGIAHQPFGGLSALSWGNGLLHARGYDGNGWLTQLYDGVGGSGAAVLHLAFGRDADGRLQSSVDGTGGNRGTSFAYSDAGRLTSAVGAWGSDAYGYDGAGNRTAFTRTIGSTPVSLVAETEANSNRLIRVTQGGSARRTFAFRSGGDLWRDVRGGATWEYGYNARKRLSSVSINGVEVGRYGYDAFGRRAWREATQGSATFSRHYLFDLDGRLLAEHDGATGAAVREYVWLDDTPLALIGRVAGQPRTLFIHAGQQDEPLAMTDVTGAVVWSAIYEPFGQATVTAAGDAALDLRLPGQELQQETGGLHQNHHRDYDPTLGRYIQSDPLGLDAGQNPYAYVDGDPLNAVDPEGLQAIPVPGPWVVPRPLPQIIPRPPPMRPPLPLTRDGEYEPIPGVPHPDEFPDEGQSRCRIVRQYCRAHCSERSMGGRSDQGMSFFRCLNRCTSSFGCGPDAIITASASSTICR